MTDGANDDGAWTAGDQVRLAVRNGDVELVVVGTARKLGLASMTGILFGLSVYFGWLNPTAFWVYEAGGRPWPFQILATVCALYLLRLCLAISLGSREPLLVIDERGAHWALFLFGQQLTVGWHAMTVTIVTEPQRLIIDGYPRLLRRTRLGDEPPAPFTTARFFIRTRQAGTNEPSRP